MQKNRRSHKLRLRRVTARRGHQVSDCGKVSDLRQAAPMTGTATRFVSLRAQEEQAQASAEPEDANPPQENKRCARKEGEDQSRAHRVDHGMQQHRQDNASAHEISLSLFLGLPLSQESGRLGVIRDSRI